MQFAFYYLWVFDDIVSAQILKIPADVTTKVILALRNTGDVAVVPSPIIFVNPGLQSALGINDVNPSAITSPNIPQTLFSTIIPVGVVGPSTIPPGPYYKAPLPAILVMSLVSMYFQLIIWQKRSWYISSP